MVTHGGWASDNLGLGLTVVDEWKTTARMVSATEENDPWKGCRRRVYESDGNIQRGGVARGGLCSRRRMVSGSGGGKERVTRALWTFFVSFFFLTERELSG